MALQHQSTKINPPVRTPLAAPRYVIIRFITYGIIRTGTDLHQNRGFDSLHIVRKVGRHNAFATYARSLNSVMVFIGLTVNCSNSREDVIFRTICRRSLTLLVAVSSSIFCNYFSRSQRDSRNFLPLHSLPPVLKSARIRVSFIYSLEVVAKRRPLCCFSNALTKQSDK